MCPNDGSYDILVKNVAVHPKSLLEAKMKSFGLISLAEEISTQTSIDSVVWLLVVTLMKIYIKRNKLSR